MVISKSQPGAVSVRSARILETGSIRLDFIDALRGFACIWVMLHHSFEHLPLGSGLESWPLNAFIYFCRAGWLGVSLFLVLSGFCLYFPLVRRNEPAAVRFDVKIFARRRAARILPPYFAALALFTAMALYARQESLPWPETAGWKDIVAHALMLHNLRPSTFASINPAFWSLALEVQLYVLFPLFVWFAAKRGLTKLALLTLTGTLLWQTAAFTKFGFSLDWAPDAATVYHAVFARCFEFVMGMLAAALVARPLPRQTQVAAAVACALIIPATAFVLAVSRFGPLLDQVWGVIFASSVLLLANIPGERFERSRLLASCAWLGTISYSVYLLHQPLIAVLAPQLFPVHLADSASVILFGLARLLVIVVIGYVFFLLLEKPFIATRRQPQILPAPASR